MTTISIVLACAAIAAPAPAGTVRSQGIFVLDHEGKSVPPDAFRRGLQTSGLAFRDGILWSVGDQRSNFPSYIFAIRPDTGRLARPPVRIEVPARTPETEAYPSRSNPDSEAIACHPGKPNVFVICLEMDGDFVVELRYEPEKERAAVLRAMRPRLDPPAKPFRDDTNYGLEGIALRADGKIFIAYERATDGLPRIYEGTWPETGCDLALKDMAIPFDSVPPREGKGRWNINDIALAKDGAGRDVLVALARDNERLVVIDLEKRTIARVVDMDLRGTEGEALHWVSPEGLAIDPAGGKLWVISDPDSVTVPSNYRRASDAAPAGLFLDLAPLLFAFKLRDIVP